VVRLPALTVAPTTGAPVFASTTMPSRPWIRDEVRPEPGGPKGRVSTLSPPASLPPQETTRAARHALSAPTSIFLIIPLAFLLRAPLGTVPVCGGADKPTTARWGQSPHRAQLFAHVEGRNLVPDAFLQTGHHNLCQETALRAVDVPV